MKLPRTFVPFLFFLSLITAKKIINCNVLIIYHSVTNHTKKLAHAIGNGVTNHNVNINVTVKPFINVTYDEIVQSSGIAIGSPVYYFATGGSFFDGTESTLSALGRALKAFGMELITPDITCSYTSSLGVAAVTGTKPFFDLPSGNVDQHFLKAAEALGKKLGEKALKQFFAK